jgi:hypothetical protein
MKFNATRFEASLIHKIAVRAVGLAAQVGIQGHDMMTATMDITACHCNGCPLKLDELARADEANFAHDVLGIRRHINRRTGQLEDCFLPRYAMAERIAA